MTSPLRRTLTLWTITAASFGAYAWLVETHVVPDVPAADPVVAYRADRDGTKRGDPVPAPLVDDYAYESGLASNDTLFIHRFARPRTTGARDPYDDATRGLEPAVLVSQRFSVREVRLNGAPLFARHSLQRWSTRGGEAPLLLPLPDELLRDDNELSILVLHASTSLPVFWLAPLRELAPAARWDALLNDNIPQIAVGAMMLVALLSLLIAWPPSERRAARVLRVTLVIWSAQNAAAISPWLPLPAPWDNFADTQLPAVAALALLAFVTAWTRQPKWTLGVCAASAAGLLAIDTGVFALGLAGVFSENTTWTLVMRIADVALFTAYAVCAIVLSGFHARERGATFSSVALLLCCAAGVADNIALLPSYFGPAAGVMLAISVLGALATRGTESRRTAVALNEELRMRVAAREAELRDVHAAQLQATRRTALLEERQRVMRDLHDGLGGTLSSLLLRLRREKELTSATLDPLERALHELRFTVDSLDETMSGSLDVALGEFRHRMEPWLNDHGLTLTWRACPEPLPGLGPEATLHVFRALQEACTNVVRHAKASELTIALEQLAAPLRVRITVADNGVGLPIPERRGRGRANIDDRAAKLGGNVRWTTDANRGTAVVLEIPLTPPSR